MYAFKQQLFSHIVNTYIPNRQPTSSMILKALLTSIILFLSMGATVFLWKYIPYRIALSKQNPFSDSYSSKLGQDTTSANGQNISKANYNESTPVLRSLTELVNLPVFGQFFMEDKIYELTKLEQWQAVIQESNMFVQNPANKFSFNIWFHKALAECYLGQLENCEDSAKTAEIYSGNKYHKMYIATVYRLLENLKKAHYKTVESEQHFKSLKIFADQMGFEDVSDSESQQKVKEGSNDQSLDSLKASAQEMGFQYTDSQITKGKNLQYKEQLSEESIDMLMSDFYSAHKRKVTLRDL